jgi:thiol-disulfide isomerase/thioredoxin
MKPVHWGVILVVLVAGAAGVYTHYLAESDGTQLNSYSVDAIPSQEFPVLIDVTGLKRPEFSLPDVSGTPRHISEWDGKVIAINFWASWCLPCLEEVPQLVELQAQYGMEGFQVIGIALQKAEEVMDFIRDNNMNYPVLAAEMAVIPVAEDYGNLLGALPYTAIIDRDGEIVFTKHGAITRDEVISVISPLL